MVVGWQEGVESDRPACLFSLNFPVVSPKGAFGVDTELGVEGILDLEVVQIGLIFAFHGASQPDYDGIQSVCLYGCID